MTRCFSRKTVDASARQESLNDRTFHTGKNRPGLRGSGRAAVLRPDKPTKLSPTYGETGALFPLCRSAFPDLPAGDIIQYAFLVQRQEHQDLNHYPHGDIPPPLLVALDRLLRDSQRGGEFGLRSTHNASDPLKSRYPVTPLGDCTGAFPCRNIWPLVFPLHQRVSSCLLFRIIKLNRGTPPPYSAPPTGRGGTS